jgi:hypothetical protein
MKHTIFADTFMPEVDITEKDILEGLAKEVTLTKNGTMEME